MNKTDAAPVAVPTRLLNTPLLVSKHEEAAIISALMGHLGAADLRALFSLADREETGGETPRLAVIHVLGGLTYRGYGWYWQTTYEQIRKDFRAALADPDVEAIVFDIDSPGGEVAGCFDLVDEIFAARGDKKLIAVANEACYSAAYAIASAAETLYVPRTGGVGSIGVRAVHVDQSKWDAAIGVSFTAITAGERKNDFSPHEPLSESARKIAQESVDRVYDLFCRTVARNRNLTEEAVRATQAAIYEGDAAVAAGLADAVASWDRAVETVSQTLEQGESIMLNFDQVKEGLTAMVSDPAREAETLAMLGALGFVRAADQAAPDDAIAAAREEGRAAGAKEAAERAVEIIGVCELAKMPTVATKLIKDGASVDTARQTVLEAKAAASGSREINTSVDPLADGEVNPLIADAQRRAQRTA